MALGRHKRHPVGVASFNLLYYRYRENARNRQYAFSLDRELFKTLTSQPCHYCGLAPEMVPSNGRKANPYNGHYTYNGLDRIDNLLGYVAGNVVPCCKICNRAKGTASHADFEAYLARVANFHQERA